MMSFKTLSLTGAVVAAALKPNLAPRFAANITVGMGAVTSSDELTMNLGMMAPGWEPSRHPEKMTLYFDRNTEQYRLQSSGHDPFADKSDLPSSSDTYGWGTWSFNKMNGACYPYNQTGEDAGFHSLFRWIYDASPAGQKVVDGVLCDVWQLGNKSICLHGDIPVEMVSERSFGRHTMLQRWIFHQPVQRDYPEQEVEVPTVCKSLPKPCGDGSIKKMDAYLFHPIGQFNISGQDVADLRGDALFLCTAGSIWTGEDYKLFSHYELSVVQSFGQYAFCNYYSPSFCFGGDNQHVGRESPYSYGSVGGQCDVDESFWNTLGIWYSLPNGGLCTDDQELGQDCFWRIDRRIKTMEMSCLLNQQSVLQACSPQPPYLDVEQILTKALTSDNVSEGGCPAVTPPGASSIVV